MSNLEGQPSNQKPTENQDPEKEQHIAAIAASLQSHEFLDIAHNESIGGNAGPNELAVNAFADTQTGEIAQFGNIQGIKEAIKNNAKYARLTFSYDIGTWEKEPTASDYISPHITEAIFSPTKFSQYAIDNINEAIKRLKEVT